MAIARVKVFLNTNVILTCFVQWYCTEWPQIFSSGVHCRHTLLLRFCVCPIAHIAEQALSRTVLGVSINTHSQLRPQPHTFCSQNLTDSSSSQWLPLLYKHPVRKKEQGRRPADRHSPGSIQDSGRYLGGAWGTVSSKMFFILMQRMHLGNTVLALEPL